MKIFATFFTLIGFFSWSQCEVKMRIRCGQEELTLNNPFASGNSDTISISTLKFYISALEINNEASLKAVQEKAFLVDLENPESMVLLTFPAKINHLHLNLGIDSSTNVAGILEGALDPINGMYWAWNSGYINFKVEGKSSAQGNFEYHLGGYLPPFQTVQSFNFAIKEEAKIIYIDFDLEKWLQQIKTSTPSTIMIPGAQAKELSELFINALSIFIEE